MKNKSPAKTLYDVKWITRFLRKENSSNKVLSNTKVIICDIPPHPGIKPSLSIVCVQTTNVLPKPNPVLVLSRMVSIDIPPEPMLRLDQHKTSRPSFSQASRKPVHINGLYEVFKEVGCRKKRKGKWTKRIVSNGLQKKTWLSSMNGAGVPLPHILRGCPL